MSRELKRPLFFANWKMNHGPTEARGYVTAFLRAFSPHPDRTVALFPPALSLAAVRDVRANRTDILLGVQNIYTQEKGAFTGENSALIARDAGAELVLVGHSERRHVFAESNLETGRKTALAASLGLTPVLCVGETIAQREMGDADRVVIEQLQVGIGQLPKSGVAEILIAYEPVWAIGTGRSATPQDASAMHRVIRKTLQDCVGIETDSVPVLYGGSVNRGNAKSLLDADGVDGLLVGSACLDPEGWAEICRT